jgi:acetyl esterase/lipase
MYTPVTTNQTLHRGTGTWRHSVFVVTVCLLAWAGCSPGAGRDPAAVAPVFAEWFVTLSSAQHKRLVRMGPDAATLDSAVSLLRYAKKAQGHGDTVLADKGGRKYTLGYYAPETIARSAGRDTTYPLIVYLHGGVNTSRTDKGTKAYRMLSGLLDSCTLFLASPSASRQSPWWDASGLWRIVQAVRFMSLYFPVDPERIFLAGVSDGATACYAAANTIAGPFAGFFAISGFGPMLPRTGMHLFPSNLAQRPIYAVHAGKDRLYPLRFVAQFVDSLQAHGVDITLSRHPGAQHGFAYKQDEYGALLKRIRTWTRPGYDGFSWHLQRGYPVYHHQMIDATLAKDAHTGFVRGYFRDDTLVCTRTNMASFTLAFSPQRDNAHFVFLHKDEKPPRKYKVHTADPSLQLALMRARACPAVDTTSRFCRIRFTR